MRPQTSIAPGGRMVAPQAKDKQPEPVDVPRGELPINLVNGAVRVGSSHALAGVPAAWSVFTPRAEASDGGVFLTARGGETDGAYHRIRLASALRCKRFLACARCKLWWMSPVWGNRGDDVPPETQFLLLELGPDGPYAIILPLLCEAPSRQGSSMFRSSLRGYTQEPSALFCTIESGDSRVESQFFPGTLYIGGGWDPFDVVSAAFRRVAAHLGTFSLREEKEAPAPMDVFGWCTWDAFYHKVTAAGIEEGILSLAECGAPVRRSPAPSAPRGPTPAPAAASSPAPADAACSGRTLPRGLSTGCRHWPQVRTLIIDDGWQTIEPDPEFRSIPSLSASLYLAVDFVQSFELAIIRLAGWALLGGAGAALAALLVAGAGHYPGVAAGLLSLCLLPYLGVLSTVAGTLEALYWGRVHTLQHGSPGWRMLARAAATPFAKRRLRAAASMLSTFQHRLTSVVANTKFRRPGEGAALGLATPCGQAVPGLGAVVDHCKNELGVQYVYAWHALCGYWGGVSPAVAENVDRYEPVMARVRPSLGVMEIEPSWAWDPIAAGGIGLVQTNALPTFYDDLHRYLAACGCDGVKVDVQAIVGTVGRDRGGATALARDVHAALNASVSDHFPVGSVINCMCHSTDNVYNFGASAVCRVSDDFYPRNPASWTAHIVNVAYNTVFLGEVVYPDWDMFHSKHPAAGMHAAARAVGGCSVYVSDAPGKHDERLLRRLVLPDGGVLRAELPGRPTADCLFTDVARDGRSALKIWNLNANNGVIGVFNVQGSWWDRELHQFVRSAKHCVPVETVVCAFDIPGFGAPGPSGKFPPGDYALYRHGAGSVTVLPARSGLVVNLAPNEWELVTIVPVKRPAGKAGTAFAPLGLVSMLNGGGAVLVSEIAPRVLSTNTAYPGAPGLAERGAEAGAQSGGAYWNSSARVVEWQARVLLRGSGTFAAFVNASPRRCKIGHKGQLMRDHAFEWRRRSGGLLLVQVPHDEAAGGETWLEITLETDPSALSANA